MEIKKDFHLLSVILDAFTARRVNCHVKLPLLAVPMNLCHFGEVKLSFIGFFKENFYVLDACNKLYGIVSYHVG